MLGKTLAQIAWTFLPARRKKLAKENIQSCIKVDEKESERIAKISTLQLGTIFTEVLRFPVL